MGRTYGPSCAGTTTSNVLPNWGTVGDAIQSSDGTETTCCTATAAAMATVNVNRCPFHLTPESSRLSSSWSQDLRPSSSLRLVESGGSCAQTLPSCGSWLCSNPSFFQSFLRIICSMPRRQWWSSGFEHLPIASRSTRSSAEPHE